MKFWRWICRPFSCQHVRVSWPRKGAVAHYIVCLDCGTRLHYDWDSMQVISQSEVDKREKAAKRKQITRRAAKRVEVAELNRMLKLK